jgi:class 3 adenylate cyclase
LLARNRPGCGAQKRFVLVSTFRNTAIDRHAAATPVEVSSSDAFRFDVIGRFGYPFGVAVHLGIVVVYIFLDQTVLAAYNVFSVTAFAAAHLLHGRGFVRLAYGIAVAEVTTYTILGTIWIGWESGVYMFSLLSAVTVFFAPFLSDSMKTHTVVAQAAIVTLLVPITRWTGVVQPLDESVAQFFLVGSLLLLMSSVALCLRAFSRAIHEAEKELTRFSLTISEYLDPMLVRSLRDDDDVSPQSRYITVFFADLAGSTRISASMEAKMFGTMIQEFVREMQRIIKANRGYLEDISGDGIFGYVGNFDSRGAEQDATSAVTLACEMQHRLMELNTMFAERYGLAEPLRMRIGVSSGEAIVGKTDGVRAVYTANSESVNLGAKLEQALKGISTGGVLLSDATASLVQGRFEVKPQSVNIEGRELAAYTVDATLS